MSSESKPKQTSQRHNKPDKHRISGKEKIKEIKRTQESIDKVQTDLRKLQRVLSNQLEALTIESTSHDNHFLDIGDKVIITDKYKNNKGVSGVIERSSKCYYWVRTSDGLLIQKHKNNVKRYR